MWMMLGGRGMLLLEEQLSGERCWVGDRRGDERKGTIISISGRHIFDVCCVGGENEVEKDGY